MKKKLLPAFLPALLSLALCATMIPAASFADQPSAVDQAQSSEAEALYQTEQDGEWQAGTFDQALLDVYDGGTIKLVKDVFRTECADLARSVTITSNDPSNPCKIAAAADRHGYLLNVNTDASAQRAASSGVVLENVIVDGGSQNGLTATRAAVAVNGGQLTLGTGAVVQNNTNEPRTGDSQSGIGGGIYVDKGTLLINGGLVAGNTAAHAYKGGGGVFVATGTCVLQSGTIRSNKAAIGGGVYADKSSAGSHAVLKLSGGSISGNAAGNKSGNYGGGVYCASGSEVRLSGSPFITNNTSGEEECGGIYLDGDGDADADVIIEGALTEQARVSFFAWKEKNNFIVAVPENNYTITSADMNQLHYAGPLFGLKLNDAGNVVLYEADFAVVAKAYGSGSISPSGKMGVFRGDSVEFTITPDEGSVVKDVTVDEQSVIDDVTDSEQGGIAVKTYALKDIQSDACVEAYFEEVPSGGGDEGGSGEGDGGEGEGADDEGADDPATPPDASSDSDQQTPSTPNENAASEGNAKSAAKTGDATGASIAAVTAIAAGAAVAAGAALLTLKRGRKRRSA